MPSIKGVTISDRRLIIAALVAVVGGVVLFALLCTGPSSSAPPAFTLSSSGAPNPIITPTPAFEASPIDGVLVGAADIARLKERLPLAIMIENHVDARPQIGLDKAELIYEAVAEGGITRFLAVYWRNEAERIEAVRSARIYYIDWAAELDAIYVHWGQVEDPGVVDVWPVLSRLHVRDLNGLFLGEAVGERDPNRFAPHNVRTSSTLLWQTAQSHGFVGPANFQVWKFKEDNVRQAATPANRAAPAMDISFGDEPSSPYAVHWDYDPASNGYVRSVGGLPHTDGVSGERLTARNIVVQFADLRPSGVKAYNVIDTVGMGSAIVFQDGVAIQATWRKDSEGSRTRFYDAAGAEIAFNRGRTWVEVVPTGSSVGY